MFAVRLSCLKSAPTLIRPALIQPSPTLRTSTLKTNRWLLQPNQGYATKPRFGTHYVKTAREELKRVAFKPSMKTAERFDATGRLILAGGAVVGLGALCYYGLGMSNEIGAIEKAAIWPQYVKDRIRTTYMYFAGSIGLTALSAVAVTRTPAIMNLMMKGSWVAIGATFAAMIGAAILVRAIPYDKNPVAKHLAWMLHAGVLGAVVAPFALFGGPVLIKAAWYTAAIVGGLSTVAMCAPSEKFLNMGAPLGIGFGLVLASSIGTFFFPPTSLIGAGLYPIAIYGGVVLFGLFLLYDTQKIIKRAETAPTNGMIKYDPINMSMGIYLDTLNIFIRMVSIVGGGRKK